MLSPDPGVLVYVIDNADIKKKKSFVLEIS